MELKKTLAQSETTRELLVHSCFKNAMNLESVDGLFVTLITRNKKMVPYGIRLPMESMPQNGVGQRAFLSHAHLSIAGSTYSLAGAESVSPAMLSLPITTNVVNLPDFLAVTSRKGGIFDAYRLILAPASATSCVDPITKNAFSQVMVLLEALKHDALSVEILKGVIGMGQGLTPCGDDFIVGLLSALWARDSHKRFLLAESCLPLLSNTTKVSAEMLAHAIKGRFSQVVLDFYRGEREQLLSFLSYGHTSGHDTLCGIHAGLSGSSKEFRREILSRI